MIIDHHHKLFFVHIPKCAGTTVRTRLLEASSDVEDHWGIETISTHGAFDVAHMPLDTLKRVYPERFALLDRYDSFAVIRDPYKRFVSSLAERTRLFTRPEGTPHNTPLSLAELDDELKNVMTLVRQKGEEVLLAPEFIHFMPQWRYVEIDGTQKVRNLFDVRETAAMSAYLENRLGTQIDLDQQDNRTLVAAKPGLYSQALKVGSALPRPVKVAARDALTRLGILKSASSFYETFLERQEVRDFIAEVYEKDLELCEAHARAVKTSAA